MAYTIDATKIVTFVNDTVNDATEINSTISELVTKHDLVANQVTGWGSFNVSETVLAIRAGVFA